MINNKGKLPYLTDSDYNNYDQKLWKSSDCQPFTVKIGNRKDIHMRLHIAIIKSILDTGHDFKLVGIHNNDMGLTYDTAQWLKLDFWSKYCTSFRLKNWI